MKLELKYSAELNSGYKGPVLFTIQKENEQDIKNKKTERQKKSFQLKYQKQQHKFNKPKYG